MATEATVSTETTGVTTRSSTLTFSAKTAAEDGVIAASSNCKIIDNDIKDGTANHNEGNIVNGSLSENVLSELQTIFNSIRLYAKKQLSDNNKVIEMNNASVQKIRGILQAEKVSHVSAKNDRDLLEAYIHSGEADSRQLKDNLGPLDPISRVILIVRFNNSKNFWQERKHHGLLKKM